MAPDRYRDQRERDGTLSAYRTCQNTRSTLVAHMFLQLALRSIDPRIDLILLESCCSRSCFSNLVAMDANEEKGREDHVRHAYAARKVEIDERGNTRFVARERVDLEDCWLATRFTPTLRLCISGCVRSTRRPSSSVFVAPERDLRPHGWW